MIDFSKLRPASGPAIQNSDYVRRINAFWRKLKPGSVAFIVANPMQKRSNDVPFMFRQSSDMTYLNGFWEPESVLVITKFSQPPYDKRVLMFVRRKDRATEIWTGFHEGKEGAMANYFADEAFYIDEFQKAVAGLIKQAKHVYYRFGINPQIDAQFRKGWESPENGEQKPLLDPFSILHEMRVHKSRQELKMLRHAGKISANAYCAAIQATKEGLTEKQLEGVLEGLFKAQGANGATFPCLVASGDNAVIIHHARNNAVLKDGGLVVADCGAEYQGYSTDLCRTWPVSGKFTQEQREIYQLVLDAQVAAIEAIRPGVPFITTHLVAGDVLLAGLKRLGIVPADAPAEAVTQFFMHATSHYMGLDVHDVGRTTIKPGEILDSRLKQQRKLESGMVLVVEPGLYFHKDDVRVPQKYRGIGVRIEDNMIVTKTGCEVISSAVPKTIEGIEKLMASGKKA